MIVYKRIVMLIKGITKDYGRMVKSIILKCKIGNKRIAFKNNENNYFCNDCT